jgi:hypothetical protein
MILHDRENMGQIESKNQRKPTVHFFQKAANKVGYRTNSKFQAVHSKKEKEITKTLSEIQI